MKKKYLIYLLIVLILTGCKDKTYKVTLIDEGKELSNIEIKKGDNLKSIPNPTKEGYIFLSWLKDGLEYNKNTPIKEDITLTATWIKEPITIKNYTVTFNFGDTIKTQTVKSGDKVPKPSHTPKKEKHKFIGWYVGDTLYDFSLPVEKDLIITAKFEKNRAKITYDLTGGEGTVIETEISVGDIPDKPNNPTKFGYTFLGWTLAGKPYNFDFPINEDVTIKALWEAIEYVKVTFDSDGGTVIKPRMIPVNTTIENLPTPIKEGFVFKYLD